MRADIVPGARFPDYELTDHARTRRRLSEIQGNDPMIVILSRGHFCPKDHQQHLDVGTQRGGILGGQFGDAFAHAGFNCFAGRCKNRDEVVMQPGELCVQCFQFGEVIDIAWRGA